MKSYLQVAVLSGLALAAAGCSKKEALSVTYLVDGTASSAKVRYMVKRKAFEERQTLPWTRTFSAAKHTPLYLAAEKTDVDGELFVTIVVDGEIVKQQSVKGPYATIGVFSEAVKPRELQARR